jgi:hypothetical protein
MLPATTVHCTGVGVAPLLKVVLHPVVPKLTTEEASAVTVAGSTGVITQEPVGGAGLSETDFTDGVQPGSVTVAVSVRRSDTVILQSGAVKFDAWILNAPLGSARKPAELVVELAMMKMLGEPFPWTRSWPPLSSTWTTVTAAAVSAMTA